ncbi:MAG: hypothetical protein UD936_10495, partial [Acutalibacteraceae bacterium]|nr:hypothetical protein [Acutalibacteraceae bacterium]
IIDRVKDKLFARCSFNTIQDKNVKAMVVEFRCYDVWGDEVGTPFSFQYLDLITKRGSTFGQTAAVEIPEKTTRKVNATIKKILLEDRTTVEASEKFFLFPESELLVKKLGSKELAEQYARETTPKAKYVVASENGYWRCTCGVFNEAAEEKCFYCGCTVDELKDKLNVEVLTTTLNEYTTAKREEQERLEREQAERIRLAEEQVKAEQEKKAKELEQAERLERKKKKKKRTIKVILSLIIIIPIITCAVIFAGIPYYKYVQAKDYLQEGKFDIAYIEFVNLNGFLDSEELVTETEYKKACWCLDNKHYFEAKELFEKLGNYEDCEDLLVETKYREACDDLEMGMHQLAKGEFEEISYYKDSDDKIDECMYGYVSSHKNNYDYATYDYLKMLKDKNYRDAKSIYNDLYEWKITSAIINTDEDDRDTHEDSVSKYCTYLQVRFQLEGGAPGETIDLTHTIYYPNGRVSFSDWDWEDKSSGSSFSAEWDKGLYSNNPQYGATGTLTIKVYNANTRELLGTVSTNITN